MNGLFLVARREVLVRGRTKGYLISMLISAAAVVVLAFLPKLLGGPDEYKVGVAGTDTAVISQALTSVKPSSPSLTGDAQATVKITEFPDEAAARAAVADGEIDAAVVNGDTLITDGGVSSELSLIIDTAYKQVASSKALAAANLPPDQVSQALASVPDIRQESVGEDAEEAGARQAIASIVVIFLFFMLMYPVMFVAMGVIEEKSSRIVEILLSTLRPWQLLGGKIIGLGILGLINVLVIAAAGLAAASASGVMPDLPPGTISTVVATLGWWMLGYAFFAALAGALGSLVSRQEDSNSTITPLTMLMIACYLVALFTAGTPKSTLAVTLSYVPPFSAMMMPMRSATGSVEWWEQVLSALILAAAVVGALALGARIYRRAVWRMGSRVKLMEALKG
ncbi:ABC transporter permease [Phytomonospora endophytica]|uniref:ABC-2 type transport system permease protein n=1 Tax=Phytomonospora endophytica TaxID=714109 RepID=A0A841FDR0_9ACTN|nr:ABC transporter permease [Phytomonospora endophytica]MBB6035411.1 ABC-2 type transport system permease protein [Phytomonospora endophytica]